MSMETFFYKLSKSCELGQKAAALAAEMEHVETLAFLLAKKMGATDYFTDPNMDAGGLVGLQFKGKNMASDDNWSLVWLDDEDDCYMPNVRIRTELIPAERAGEYKGSNVMVSQQTMPFEQVQFKFSREEAADMAGIHLTTPSLERLGKRHKINRRKLNMLSLGVPVEKVLPDASEEQKREICKTQIEDKLIQDAMRGKQFRLVYTYEGKPKALEIFKEWNALPVIPEGTVNALLGVKCNTHRCGLLDCGDYIIVSSAVEIQNEEFTPSNVQEYEAGRLIGKERLKQKEQSS